MTDATAWTVLRARAELPRPVDDTRYELIGGVLFIAPQTHWEHQLVCGRLLTALHGCEHNAAGLAVRAPGVIFDEDEALAPDVVWVARHRLASLLDPDGYLRGAPDLVAEVLYPGDAQNDLVRHAKLDVYSRRRVREYWIVDWQARTVDIFRPQGDALELAASLGAEDTLESPLLLGFSCRVAELFSGVR